MTFDQTVLTELLQTPIALDANHCERQTATPISYPVRDDAGLMLLVAQGDAGAFGKLVELHSLRLYRLGYRMLGNAADAEDAVQEAFTRLWQFAPRWKHEGGGLATWLYRVVMNRCLDQVRRFRIVACDELAELADQGPGPERSLAMEGLAQSIEHALASLPGRHRAAIVLCYFEGLSNATAANALDLNLKALESLLFRARRSLREILEQQGVSCDDLELLA